MPGGWRLATDWYNQLGRGLRRAQPARCVHQPPSSPLLGAEDRARGAAARALEGPWGHRQLLSWESGDEQPQAALCCKYVFYLRGAPAACTGEQGTLGPAHSEAPPLN